MPPLTDIHIKIIPHTSQRYPTLGDWQFTTQLGPDSQKEDCLYIHVSAMSDPRAEQGVAVHELIEALICRTRGITTDQVDAWDFAHADLDEPGDHPDAPYHREHKTATRIEYDFIDELDLSSLEYEAILARAENPGMTHDELLAQNSDLRRRIAQLEARLSDAGIENY